jgi:hypothetical protein
MLEGITKTVAMAIARPNSESRKINFQFISFQVFEVFPL